MDKILYVDVPEAVCRQRVLKRRERLHKAQGRSFVLEDERKQVEKVLQLQRKIFLEAEKDPKIVRITNEDRDDYKENLERQVRLILEDYLRILFIASEQTVRPTAPVTATQEPFSLHLSCSGENTTVKFLSNFTFLSSFRILRASASPCVFQIDATSILLVS